MILGNSTLLKRLKQSIFFKNALAYSGTNAIEQVLVIIRGFVVRRILPPEIMGFWNFMTVIQGFLGMFDLGCITGANRELPIMHGKHDNVEVTKIHSAAFWFTLLQNIIISIITSLYFYWNRSHYVSWEIIAAYVGILVFLITSFQIIYITFFVTSQAFVPLSKISLAGSIIDVIGFPFCAYIWGLSGIMLMAVASTLLRCVFFSFLHI